MADGSRVSRSFATLDGATAWIATQTDMAPGTRTQPRRGVTVREAGENLLRGIESGRIRTKKGTTYKPSVLLDYRRDLEKTIYPTLGDDLLTRVRRRDVQDLIEALSGKGLAANTVRNRVKPLQVIYSHAVADELVAASPCEHVRWPSNREKPRSVAPVGSVAAMLRALEPEPVMNTAWALMMLTGMRIGEARGLLWSDVDRARGALTIRYAWCNRSHQLVNTKTDGSTRSVALTPTIADSLARLADERGPEPTSALILHGAKGLDRPLSDNVIRRHSAKLWTAAGLPEITPHEARHTYATMMVEGGMPTDEVGKHLGHTTGRLVYARYHHLQPEALTRAATLVEELIGAPQPDVFDSLDGLGARARTAN